MTVDFGSELLDVFFALAFIYFLLSLVVSAVTEAVSWFMQQRSRKLLGGIRALLADERENDQLTKDVLGHWLVKGMNKQRKHLPNVDLPSYVSPRNFALALVDSLEKPEATLESSVAGLPRDLRQQLQPLLKAAGSDVADFRKSIERWYDDAMDRVSGWYKRWAQVVTIVVALIVTLAFNVDTIRVTNRLFNDDAVRARVISAGESALREGGTARIGEGPVKSGEKAEAAADELSSLKLPIGWDTANDNLNGATAFGWLLTAIAISLGAPFWFDALGRLARLRTTGKRPSREDDESP
jgi:hypothetical protein